jgi:CHAT domain-containing protein/Flp pilus assembly protein TadD
MPDVQEPAAREPTSFTELQELVEHALSLSRHGRAAEALRAADLAQRSLATIEVPRSRDGAGTLNHLGITFFENGYGRAAEPLYALALSIAEALVPADGELTEDVLNNLGQAHDRRGNTAQARAFLEQSVEMRARRAPDSVALAVNLDNLGGVYRRSGDLARAEDHHHRALTIFERERGPFDPHLATALGNLSGVYTVRRDFERAEAFRLRALDIHARAEGLTSSGALIELNGLIAIYLDKGDVAAADRLVNHVLSIGGTAPRPEHRFLADVLSSLSHVAFGEFRLDLAERLGVRAVDLLEALEGPRAPETLRAVYMLANVQRATYDLERAELNYRRALQGFEGIGESDLAVTVSIDLGKLYRERGAYQLGEMVLDTAVKRLGERSEHDPSLLASALGNLALLYYDSSRYQEADVTFASALEASRKAKDDVERPWLLHGRGLLNYHLGRYAIARDLYDEARRLWIDKDGPDHPFVATATANLALAHWAVGDIDGALDSFRAAAERRNQGMRRILAVGSERKRLLYARGSLDDLHKVLSFLFTAPGHAGVARFAAELALQRKGLVLDAIAHTFTQIRVSRSAEDSALVDQLQTVRTEIAGLVTPSPLAPRARLDSARLGHLRDEEERIEASLSYRGALHDPDLAPVTLPSVQHALPGDGALIEMLQYRRFNPTRAGTNDVWGEDRYAALVLRPAREPRWIDLGPASTIDTKGDALRRLLRSRSSAAADLERASAELYVAVIAPLENAIDGARRLLISPDGKLAMVPLGVLRDAKGRALGATYTVSYAATGREIQYLTTATPSTSGVVVVAAPDYDVEASQQLAATADTDRFADRGAFAALEGAKAEAREIAGLLADVTILEGAAATVEAVQKVAHPAVLHVATHGFFSPIEEPEARHSVEFLPIGEGMLVEQRQQVAVANPMFFSGLALTGANRRPPGTSTGILTAQQIAGLDLRGTQLVVLSACETGLGMVERGSEFTGMRRALSIAGAATQITSLWRVGDEATRALMRHFYTHLIDGIGRAEALARAQEAIESDREHPEWKHPFYWAAFVVSGAWTPMHGDLRP